MFIPKLDEMAAEHFGSEVPSTSELERRTAVAFISTHPSFDDPAPLPPNVIPVAGLHIPVPKSLPEAIASFINGSEKGAIFFALGSNVRSEFMDLATQQELLDAFRRMPEYNFLWKFESSIPIKDLPKNVLIQKWMPQSDILAHPKTKGFFTHSGLLSVQEAIWHAVPMLCLPFLYDQHMVGRKFVVFSSFESTNNDIFSFNISQNAKKVRNHGIGEIISYPSISSELVISKIRLLLEDPW